MKRKILLPLCLAMALQGQAQSDVSSFFMTNNGFDTNFNYDTSQSGNVSGDVINEVYGWTNETTATYTVAGTFAYNKKASFNNSFTLPEAGYNNSEGGALALSTGWGMELLYTQTVTLPKGTYKLCSAYYNAGSSTAGKSLLAWIPNSGSMVASSVSSFPVRTWKTDTLTFTLTTSKTGKIRIGLSTSEGSGSSNHAKVLVDYVKLLCVDIDKSELKTALTAANKAYSDGTGIYATELKAVIDKAQAVYDDTDALATDVLELTQELLATTQTYKNKNASEDNPITMTSLITNPSFENDTTGWTNNGMKVQTNTYFPSKSGSKYMESWVEIGSKVPDVSISQSLTGLQNGKYRLRAAVGNIQQKAKNSAINAGDKQTGATLFAGYYEEPVDTIKSRKSLYFTVVDGKASIGFKTHNATGNWVCVDNFVLHYIGEYTTEDYADYLAHYASYTRNAISTKHIQTSTKEAVEAAIEKAESAAAALPLDKAALTEAKAALDEATKAIETSEELYAELSKAIKDANQVKEWYEDNETKRTKMETAIQTAQEALANEDLTDTELQSAIDALNKTTANVDKKTYAPEWSLGDINDPNNKYYIGRSKKSKDWIIFWEKGYGENPTSLKCGSYNIDINELLNRAEIAFNFYADSLKFITRGKSKTDTYRMIIRFRYEPTEWEASGSGIDDCIGLLTLTPWAASSRNWQTLYHEIGHCFQYQTHCDNGDQNGWMYAPGGGQGCAFWEQCAQWQAYKIMPNEQFTNEWFSGYLNNVHKHILHESPRYNNYFIQDYWAYKHGVEFIGQLWNKSKNPEDAVEAYIRLNNITTSEFNDEMYDCAARFATWDIPALEKYGASKIDSRPLPAMTDAGSNYWRINAAVAPENTGHNIIKLNVPTDATTVTACFEGLNNQSGYNVVKPTQAEWRYGFVAQLNDDSRVYGNMGKSTYSDPKDTISFNCPANCKRLYFVVSGGPKTYWCQVWDSNSDNDEQWPYQVKFGNTNRYGSANVADETGIETVMTNTQTPDIYVTGRTLHVGQSSQAVTVSVYTLSGNCVMKTPATLSAVNVDLSSGIYLVRVASTGGRIQVTKKIALK